MKNRVLIMVTILSATATILCNLDGKTGASKKSCCIKDQISTLTAPVAFNTTSEISVDTSVNNCDSLIITVKLSDGISLSYEWIKISDDELEYIEKESGNISKRSYKSGWCK